MRTATGGAAHVSGTELETRLQSICEAALPGKRIDVNDNLFDIGASSLKLIEIHENIDRDFPGLVDLTELFDHPTIAELAKHLETQAQGDHPITRRSASPRTPVNRRRIAASSTASAGMTRANRRGL